MADGGHIEFRKMLIRLCAGNICTTFGTKMQHDHADIQSDQKLNPGLTHMTSSVERREQNRYQRL